MGLVARVGGWKRKLLWFLGLVLLLGLVGLGGWLITIHFLTEHHLREARRAAARQRFPQAWEHLCKANAYRPRSTEIHLLMARVARQKGDFAGADEHLRRCQELRRGRQTADEQLEQLMLRAEMGEVTKVRPLLWPYVSEGRPEASLVLEALSAGYLSEHQYPQADHCARKWLDIDPDNIQALVCRGMLEEGQRDFDKAQWFYSRALDLDPERNDVRLRLASALVSFQHDGEAITHFQRLLRRDPDHLAARLGLAHALRNVGRLKEARTHLEDFLRDHPDEPSALTELGQVAFDAGDFADAERAFRKALRIDPAQHHAIYSLIMCLRRLGRQSEIPVWTKRTAELEKAQRRLDEILRRDYQERPNDADLCYEAGALSEQLGSQNEATHWYSKALQHNPYHQKALKAVIKGLDKRGDKEQADELRARLTEK